MHIKSVPEHNVTVPNSCHNLLHDSLSKELLSIGNSRDLQRIEPAERRSRVLFVVLRLVGMKARRQTRERLQELRALDGLVALGKGAPRAAVGSRRAAEEGRAL